MSLRHSVLLVLSSLLGFIVLSSTREGRAQSQHDVESETTRLGEVIFDQMLESQDRVMRVADRIRIAAIPLCDEQGGSVLGVFTANEKTFHDLWQGDLEFEEAVHRAATHRFELDERETVLVVVPGLPADLAGVLPGDVISQINGRKVSSRHRLQSLRVKDDSGRISLNVERGGEDLELSVKPSVGCAYPSRSSFGNSISAFATRQAEEPGTYVRYGLLDLFGSDDDLAIILGHELAHLILDTGGTKRTEADADYFGLYLAARAGFKVSGALEVWDRMAQEIPYATVDWDSSSHPTSAARSSELEATVEEISAKLETGEPLDPEGKW